MAKSKKDFRTGISLLIQPVHSTPNDDSSADLKIDEEQTPNKQSEMEIEEQTSVHFRMPVSKKIKMEHYCTDHRIKQQQLIVDAITKYIT